MKALTGIKGKRNKTKQKLNPSRLRTTESDFKLAKDENWKESPSVISVIISGLIAESEQNDMLIRLKFKLSKTTEEINKLISEL